MNKNMINWFEIPAKDLERAVEFYSEVMQFEIPIFPMEPNRMGFFPYDKGGTGKVSGAIVEGPMHEPCTKGSVLYLNANPDLQPYLDRVEGAGGQIVMPKTMVTEEIGYMAFFTDTEGNKLAFHSQS